MQNLQKLAEDLIGQIVYVGWPYLTEAMVHSISDGKVQYYKVRMGKGGRGEEWSDGEGWRWTGTWKE